MPVELGNRNVYHFAKKAKRHFGKFGLLRKRIALFSGNGLWRAVFTPDAPPLKERGLQRESGHGVDQAQAWLKGARRGIMDILYARDDAGYGNAGGLADSFLIFLNQERVQWAGLLNHEYGQGRDAPVFEGIDA